MESNLTIAIVSASGAVAVAVLNSIWMGRAFGQLDKRLSVIETDLKEFFRIQSAHAVDIQHLKDTKQEKG